MQTKNFKCSSCQEMMVPKRIWHDSQWHDGLACLKCSSFYLPKMRRYTFFGDFGKPHIVDLNVQDDLFLASCNICWG